MARPVTGLVGVSIALVSAAAFATSGSFAASLLDAGWSPGAAVTVRVLVAAALLTAPALLRVHRASAWAALWEIRGRVVLYGLFAVAGTQLCYFMAIERLPVAVALLLEYSAVLLVVLWTWLRQGDRPGQLMVVGSVLSIAGLVLVLEVASSAVIDPIGVIWGLAAAVGLAVYFVLSADDRDDVPPLAVAWGGLVVGGVVLAGVGALVGLPFSAPAVPVTLLSVQVSWLVPVVGVSVVAGAVAYTTGVAGARRLGARVASFVGLSEVLFAVLFAWALVGQSLSSAQLLGCILVVGGIAVVKLGEQPTAPDAGGRVELPVDVGGGVHDTGLLRRSE